MGEYIKRADAIQAVKDCSYSLDEDELIEVNGFSAIDSINNLPTADVVEVIRCKDCEYWTGKNPDSNKGVGYCKCNDEYFNDDDYCSYGERKTNDE